MKLNRQPRTWLTALMAALIGLGSCSDNSAQGGRDKPPAAQENVFGLIGLEEQSYQTECQLQAGKQNFSFREVAIFYKNSFDRFWYSFEGTDCKDESLLVTYSYAYKAVERRTSPELADWTTFRYSYESIQVTPNSQSIVDAFNSKQVYLHDQWTLDESKDVTGRSYSVNQSPLPSRGDRRVSTVKVEEERVLFARYVNEVPTDKDPLVYFKKQNVDVK